MTQPSRRGTCSIAQVAVFDEPIDVLADVSGLRRRLGERYRTLKGDTRFRSTVKLREQRTLHAVEMKVPPEWLGERLDKRQGGRRAVHLGDRDAAIERHDR